MSMENSNDNIGIRTRDLPTCSAVPQPTALPLVPLVHYSIRPNIRSHIDFSSVGICSPFERVEVNARRDIAGRGCTQLRLGSCVVLLEPPA